MASTGFVMAFKPNLSQLFPASGRRRSVLLQPDRNDTRLSGRQTGFQGCLVKTLQRSLLCSLQQVLIQSRTVLVPPFGFCRFRFEDGYRQFLFHPRVPRFIVLSGLLNVVNFNRKLLCIAWSRGSFSVVCTCFPTTRRRQATSGDGASALLYNSVALAGRLPAPPFDSMLAACVSSPSCCSSP